MQLTYQYATVKELAIQFGISYDKARYQVQKMVKSGEAQQLEAVGTKYYRLLEKPLTINDSFDLAMTYTFKVTDKRDKDLAIHFATTYRTTRRNAQIAISKFLKSNRQEGWFYEMRITK